MISAIGIPGLLILFVLVLLLFGPSKLPKLGKAVGDTLQEFRSSARRMTEQDHEGKEK